MNMSDNHSYYFSNEVLATSEGRNYINRADILFHEKLFNYWTFYKTSVIFDG
jgi:hypothetical protein